MKNLSKKLILSVGVLALGALAAVGVMSKTATAADSAPATYVGQATCAQCHADKAKDYSMTGHVADFQPLSDFVVTNAGKVQVSVTDPDTKTNPATATVTLDSSSIFGVFMDDHIVVKAPAGFAQKYIRLGELDKNADGTYTIEADAAESFASCAKCHAPGEAVGGQTTSAEAGITCEACHGPGSTHVAAKTTAERKATMAPSMTPETCYKCHPVDNAPASTVNTGSGLPSTSTLQAVNHYGVRGFYATKHYTSSKLNSCLTCHDPHVQPKAGYLLKVADPENDKAENLCNQCHANLVTSDTITQAFWINPTDSRTAANVSGHNTRDHSFFQIKLSDYVYDPAKAGFQLGPNAAKQLRALYPEIFTAN